MEKPSTEGFLFKPEAPPMNSSESFSNKNTIIIVLVALLILSFLGINLLSIAGEFFQSIINIFGPLVGQILSFFGLSHQHFPERFLPHEDSSPELSP
jgi:hypothetical protein